MLMWPKYNLPFDPTLSYWLGGIATFDREETLGEALKIYNPNKLKDRESVIKKFILPRFSDFTYRHRFLLFKILENSLSKPEFNFSYEFESDFDNNECIAWDETEIDDPRGFFEDIYRLASEEWKDDLQKASSEDPSDW